MCRVLLIRAGNGESTGHSPAWRGWGRIRCSHPHTTTSAWSSIQHQQEFPARHHGCSSSSNSQV